MHFFQSYHDNLLNYITSFCYISRFCIEFEELRLNSALKAAFQIFYLAHTIIIKFIMKENQAYQILRSKHDFFETIKRQDLTKQFKTKKHQYLHTTH